MTNVSRESFLLKLYEVVHKLSTIAKNQSYYFKTKWTENFPSLNHPPKLVRLIPVIKEKFLHDIDHRIEILDTVCLSFEDGFNLIKFLLDILYNHYFENSGEFRLQYSQRDQLILKYLVAKEILGNLIEYNKLDHETVPLKYNILARNYAMIKLRRLDGVIDDDVLNNMKKINIELSLDDLRNLMDEIVEDGFFNKIMHEDHFYYGLKSELMLTVEGIVTYNQTIISLVKWPTRFWDDYYNIRELNVTVDNETENSEFLNKVLKRAATQGYSACHYVFENLVKYYQDIKKELN